MSAEPWIRTVRPQGGPVEYQVRNAQDRWFTIDRDRPLRLDEAGGVKVPLGPGTYLSVSEGELVELLDWLPFDMDLVFMAKDRTLEQFELKRREW